MDTSTSLTPYFSSSSLNAFGIAHVANEAQPMINNVFINVFDLNIIMFFVGGTLFLEK
jgi:hypothetical protein